MDDKSCDTGRGNYMVYQYMRSENHRAVSEEEMKKHEDGIKKNLFPRLRMAQQKKEDGARIASAFLLD